MLRGSLELWRWGVVLAVFAAQLGVASSHTWHTHEHTPVHQHDSSHDPCAPGDKTPGPDDSHPEDDNQPAPSECLLCVLAVQPGLTGAEFPTFVQTAPLAGILSLVPETVPAATRQLRLRARAPPFC